jgi:hypothetical protein
MLKDSLTASPRLARVQRVARLDIGMIANDGMVLQRALDELGGIQKKVVHAL